MGEHLVSPLNFRTLKDNSYTLENSNLGFEVDLHF